MFQIDECSELLNLLPCLVTHLLYLYQEFFYLVALLRKRLSEYLVPSSPFPQVFERVQRV